MRRGLLPALACSSSPPRRASAQLSPGELSRFHQALEGVAQLPRLPRGRQGRHAAALPHLPHRARRRGSPRDGACTPAPTTAPASAATSSTRAATSTSCSGARRAAPRFDHALTGVPARRRHTPRLRAAETCHDGPALRTAAHPATSSAARRERQTSPRTFLGPAPMPRCRSGATRIRTTPRRLRADGRVRGLPSRPRAGPDQPRARFDHGRTRLSRSTGRHARSVACAAAVTPRRPAGKHACASTGSAASRPARAAIAIPHAGRLGAACATLPHAPPAGRGCDAARFDHGRTALPAAGPPLRGDLRVVPRPGGSRGSARMRAARTATRTATPASSRAAPTAAAASPATTWTGFAPARFTPDDHAKTRLSADGRATSPCPATPATGRSRASASARSGSATAGPSRADGAAPLRLDGLRRVPRAIRIAARPRASGRARPVTSRTPGRGDVRPRAHGVPARRTRTRGRALPCLPSREGGALALRRTAHAPARDATTIRTAGSSRASGAHGLRALPRADRLDARPLRPRPRHVASRSRARTGRAVRRLSSASHPDGPMIVRYSGIGKACTDCHAAPRARRLPRGER